MTVERCTDATAHDWLAFRALLWPEVPDDDHRKDVARILADYPRFVTFLARDDGRAVGFAEASLRTDYVNGCDTTPVAFLEGIYVDEAHRNRGAARLLCAAIEQWARERGCSEFASDAYDWDENSHAFHRAVGFGEMERVVYFKKAL
jgi:aminoglycoside 6'-N-acetyltransferase I